MNAKSQEAELLSKASRNIYPNLMIRIGDYSEYFNRLSDEFKKELLKRNAQRI